MSEERLFVAEAAPFDTCERCDVGLGDDEPDRVVTCEMRLGRWGRDPHLCGACRAALAAAVDAFLRARRAPCS